MTDKPITTEEMQEWLYTWTPKGNAIVDAIRARLADHDVLKAEVERLRNEQASRKEIMEEDFLEISRLRREFGGMKARAEKAEAELEQARKPLGAATMADYDEAVEIAIKQNREIDALKAEVERLKEDLGTVQRAHSYWNTRADKAEAELAAAKEK